MEHFDNFGEAYGLIKSNTRLFISRNVDFFVFNLKKFNGQMSFVFFWKIFCIMKIETGKGKWVRKKEV